MSSSTRATWASPTHCERCVCVFVCVLCCVCVCVCGFRACVCVWCVGVCRQAQSSGFGVEVRRSNQRLPRASLYHHPAPPPPGRAPTPTATTRPSPPLPQQHRHPGPAAAGLLLHWNGRPSAHGAFFWGGRWGLPYPWFGGRGRGRSLGPGGWRLQLSPTRECTGLERCTPSVSVSPPTHPPTQPTPNQRPRRSTAARPAPPSRS